MHTTTQHPTRAGCHLISILLLTAFLQPEAHAQINNLNKGDRIRVFAPGVHAKSIVGTVYEVSSYGVLLSTKDSSMSIPNTSLKRLDISTGTRRHAGKGALIGAVAGGLTLGLIAMAGNNSDDDSCENSTGWVCFNPFQFSDGLAFTAGAFAGTLGGALVGGAIGASIKSDRWERMPVTFSAGLTPIPTKNFSLHPAVSVSISLKRKP